MRSLSWVWISVKSRRAADHVDDRLVPAYRFGPPSGPVTYLSRCVALSLSGGSSCRSTTRPSGSCGTPRTVGFLAAAVLQHGREVQADLPDPDVSYWLRPVSGPLVSASCALGTLRGLPGTLYGLLVRVTTGPWSIDLSSPVGRDPLG